MNLLKVLSSALLYEIRPTCTTLTYIASNVQRLICAMAIARWHLTWDEGCRRLVTRHLPFFSRCIDIRHFVLEGTTILDLSVCWKSRKLLAEGTNFKTLSIKVLDLL